MPRGFLRANLGFSVDLCWLLVPRVVSTLDKGDDVECVHNTPILSHRRVSRTAGVQHQRRQQASKYVGFLLPPLTSGQPEPFARRPSFGGGKMAGNHSGGWGGWLNGGGLAPRYFC